MKKLLLLPLVLLAGCGSALEKQEGDPNQACENHRGVKGTATAATAGYGNVTKIGVTCNDGYYTTVNAEE